jgi:hypothetical protein
MVVPICKIEAEMQWIVWTTLDISGDDHTNEKLTTSYGKQ